MQEIKERIVDEFAKTGMRFIEIPSGLKATVNLKVGREIINIGEAKDTLDEDTFNSLIKSSSELIVEPVKE